MGSAEIVDSQPTGSGPRGGPSSKEFTPWVYIQVYIWVYVRHSALS